VSCIQIGSSVNLVLTPVLLLDSRVPELDVLASITATLHAYAEPAESVEPRPADEGHARDGTEIERAVGHALIEWWSGSGNGAEGMLPGLKLG
jgi:hypothetical protein